MIHTDEDIAGYGLENEFDELRDIFDREEDDVIAIIAAEAENAKNAAQEARKRAEMLYEGRVPEETRNAEQDFTTSYSRPLPGASRMYPETDIPPITVTEEEIEEIDENLPDTLEERQERYAKEIGEELASQIVSSRRLGLFEKFKDETDPKLVANVFTNIYSQLESDGVRVDQLEEEHYRALFDALEDEIKKGDIEEVLSEMAETNLRPKEAIQEAVAGKASEDEIREVVKEVIEENSEMVEGQGMQAQGALMGDVMARVEADGGTVSRILQEGLQERT
jgi:glutamyl-tRNA(Gln) amidotransferase subunit E